MPRTIDEGFRDFLKELTPSEVESENARSHRATIKACLESSFGLTRFTRIGSFGNGTSISGYSDVDYLACLRKQDFTANSAYFLGKVCDALVARFPKTGVRVNSPAITVPFGSSIAEHTEVIPADYMLENSGSPVYDIADGAGGWMKTSPDAHNAYVRAINDKLNGKLKPLVRFVKAWKYFADVPVYLYLKVQTATERSVASRLVVAVQDPATVLITSVARCSCSSVCHARHFSPHKGDERCFRKEIAGASEPPQ
jgi:Second Messenger Oligonucleotide or Dinucleotide Synthetase domain